MGLFRNIRLKKEREENERIISELVEQIKDSDIVNDIYARLYQWAQDYFIPLWKAGKGINYNEFFFRVDESRVCIYQSDPDPYGSPNHRATIFVFTEHGYNNIHDWHKQQALKRALSLKPGLDSHGYLDRSFWDPIMYKYCPPLKDAF